MSPGGAILASVCGQQPYGGELRFNARRHYSGCLSVFQCLFQPILLPIDATLLSDRRKPDDMTAAHGVSREASFDVKQPAA